MLHPAIADRRGTARAGAPCRANTPRKRRNTIWKRFCASCGGRSATGGCLPITSSSSGTRLTMSWPFGPSASRSAVPPPAELRLALAEERADKALEGLGQGRIGDVALVLVELAGREQAARRDQRLVQLVDHRGLADAGIAGHQHELGCAVAHHPVEGREQRVDLALAAVELLRDQQPVRHVVRAEREWLDAADAPPIPPGIAADRPRRPRRSGSAPRRSWREASSRSPRAAPGRPRPARRAAAAAARCGSAPTPSDRRR